MDFSSSFCISLTYRPHLALEAHAVRIYRVIYTVIYRVIYTVIYLRHELSHFLQFLTNAKKKKHSNQLKLLLPYVVLPRGMRPRRRIVFIKFCTGLVSVVTTDGGQAVKFVVTVVTHPNDSFIQI